MKSEQASKESAEAERKRKALIKEKLAFDGWLEFYEDANEAGGEGL
ncbi:MAG: hypothetical protein IT365_29420 [Candidatus Hydrogenedentes bacterium]|nr:hypothetical protein [Candidatus Hydrogenedentota bacterium]